MIFTFEHLTQDQTLSADIVVVGSGAGGAAAAWEASRKGKKVIVIESGSFLTPRDFDQREENMFPKLFYDCGARRTANKAIRVLHGQGVGGSTLHNINLCKRLPEKVFQQWQLQDISYTDLVPYFKRVEELLGIVEVTEAQLNRSNQLLRQGVKTLGYRGGHLKHNREGCYQSGFCELGCSFDAKLNAARVLIPQSVKRGTTVLANTRARFLKHNGKTCTQVLCETRHPETKKVTAHITVKAKTFVIAGGAVETPLLLQRSEVPDPYEQVGQRIHLHPGVVCAGVFSRPVLAWKGIPQGYECTEFLDFDHPQKRVWIITGAAHPAGTATLLPGFGVRHAQMMKLYPYLCPLSSMIHDHSTGTIRERQGRPWISYSLSSEDRQQLALGLRESTRLLLAAGATKVVVPFFEPLTVRHQGQLESLPSEVREHALDMVAVHPMGSVRMGDKAEKSCVTTEGRSHHLINLFVADASLFPTSIGVPPQVTTYAMGLRIGEIASI